MRPLAGWLLSVGGVVAAVVVAGCGLLDGGSGPQVPQRRTEALVEAEPGLEGAVRVDSVSWLPAMPDDRQWGLNADELEGSFAALFQNTGSQPASVRYELRFYDADTFLLDAFFPFGQPLLLAAGEQRWVRGQFRLRLPVSALDQLARMVLAARVGPAGG